jgi:hypothetical protein
MAGNKASSWILPLSYHLSSLTSHNNIYTCIVSLVVIISVAFGKYQTSNCGPFLCYQLILLHLEEYMKVTEAATIFFG